MIKERVIDFFGDKTEITQLHRLAFAMLQKELSGKVKHKPVEEIVEETRKIRRELWEKRK